MMWQAISASPDTMAKLDTDESGEVEKDEYRRFVEKKHEWTSDDWAPAFAEFDADASKSLDREEMLALLAADNVMRAAHTSSFDPTFTYQGDAVEAGALVTIDGYKNVTHNITTNVTTTKTQLAGSVLVNVKGADVSFQFDTRNGGSYSLAASKTWEFDWGVFVLYGSFGSGDCDDTVTADAITLKTAIAGGASCDV